MAEKSRVAVTLDKNIIERLDALAAAAGVSRSAIVALSVLDYQVKAQAPITSEKAVDYTAK